MLAGDTRFLFNHDSNFVLGRVPAGTLTLRETGSALETDGRVERSEYRRICPPTGTSLFEAWQRTLPALGPVPVLPEPFDLVAIRTVPMTAPWPSRDGAGGAAPRFVVLFKLCVASVTASE